MVLPSPAPPSTQKKQQPISRFFSSTPAAVTREPKTNVPFLGQESDNNENEALPKDGLFVSDGEDTSGGARRFSSALKRAATNDETADPPPRSKRQRPSLTATSPTPSLGLEASVHEENVVASATNAGRVPKATARTSKYMFSSSPAVANNEDEADASDDSQARRARAELRQKFVKKLGRPEIIANIKRRNGTIDGVLEDAAAGEEEDDEDDEEEEEAVPKGRGRKSQAIGKDKGKLTPLMQQVMDLKRKHPDTMLVVESGYKYHIYGEDARAASKVLSLVCLPGRLRFDDHPSEANRTRFAKMSFPILRLHVHVRRLVSAGYKVGVVQQLETRALKAISKNKSKIFERGLTQVYTKGTYIDDPDGINGDIEAPDGGAPATGHLLCMTESLPKGLGSDEKVTIGFIAVQPATGDIIYDDFEDGWMRSELETRLLHISPCEMLLVGEVSKATEKLVKHICGGDDARLERVGKPKAMSAQAYSHITKFYADKLKDDTLSSSQVKSSQETGTLLDEVHKLSENATVCLSAMITHLTDYKLQHVFDLTKNFQSFSARSHMLLNGNTLTSLEVFRNQTDQSERGSLFWTLDRTRTKFGRRLLRKWVGRPLLDRDQLLERVAAIEELKEAASSPGVFRITELLKKTRNDLEKTLIRIYYKRCLRAELLGLLQTLQAVAQEYAHVESADDVGFHSSLLNQAIASLPIISDDVVGYLDRINAEAARSNDKYDFFREEFETDDITNHKMGIVAVEHDLDDFRKIAADKLKRKKVDYITVAGIDYLIELDNTQLKNVPASWIKVSSTRKASRYHAPEVIKLMRERDQHKESLSNACDAAFAALLSEIGSKYQAFRDCIQSLALLDCLLSLAEVATQPGYCKPQFAASPGISITAGRHPMVEQLLLDAFVPNDIHLSNDEKSLMLTGPNMGGKSSYVRSIALIAIMAQIGSYVPADAAELGLLDAVFTRMGAFDNMMKGESTFMVELGETSDILKQATPRSLVILDELGRGTSTHDGVAIAQAVLHHLVTNLKPFTLFITHYQTLSRMAGSFDGSQLRNMHMRFNERETETGDQEITFLYEVGEGVAHRSYGLNVAKLAGLPRSLLDEAGRRSRAMEEAEKERRVAYLSKVTEKLMQLGGEEHLEHLVAGIEQL